jgi:hypothetical protein
VCVGRSNTLLFVPVPADARSRQFFSVGSKILGESAGPNGECVAVVVLWSGVSVSLVSHKSKGFCFYF